MNYLFLFCLFFLDANQQIVYKPFLYSVKVYIVALVRQKWEVGNEEEFVNPRIESFTFSLSAFVAICHQDTKTRSWLPDYRYSCTAWRLIDNWQWIIDNWKEVKKLEMKKWEFRPKNLPWIITKLSADICVKSFFCDDQRELSREMGSEKWKAKNGGWRMEIWLSALKAA